MTWCVTWLALIIIEPRRREAILEESALIGLVRLEEVVIQKVFVLSILNVHIVVVRGNRRRRGRYRVR